MASLRVATWNTEWRKSHSNDGKIIRERLSAVAPDIVVLTETHSDFLADWSGYTLTGAEEYEEVKFRTRRSVLLWSRWPWRDIDEVGSSRIVTGCFLKAVTDAPHSSIPVIGLIIPYAMSNVATGSRQRRAWEDHERCLDALSDILPRLPENTLVVGDYNQRLPFVWGSRRLNEKLLTVFSNHAIATTGTIMGIGEQAIDHIACGRAWRWVNTASMSNSRDDGGQISDHFGVIADLEFTSA